MPTQSIMEELEAVHAFEDRFLIENGAFSYLMERFPNALTEEEREEAFAAQTACRTLYDRRGTHEGNEAHSAATSRLSKIRRRVLNRLETFTRAYATFYAACHPVRLASDAAYNALAAARAEYERAEQIYHKTFSKTAKARLDRAQNAVNAAQNAWRNACEKGIATYRGLRRQHLPAEFQIN